MHHEDGISVLGTNKSQKEPYQVHMADEEEFQIHIQSQQSWQIMTCGQGRCPARAEHCEPVSSSLCDFLAKQSQFACIIGTINMVNRAIMLKIINYDHPLTIPKD